MKRLILFSMVCLVSTATRAQTDSIRTETLPEIVVNSDGQIETAEKAVLLPTMTEKKHSANGFDLLNVMQTAELEVSPRTRSITTLIGWDDVAEFNIDFERDIACWWHHNMPERLTRLYEKKMSVVLTPRMPMYFDYRQNESHKYGMRHWGTVTLDNVYAFPQDSVLAPTTKGLEACVWTEFIPDVKRLDYMVYPRLPAMAEAAWTDKARKHFDDFLLRLKREMVYYDSKGINYYQYFSPEGQEEPAPTLNDVFKD